MLETEYFTTEGAKTIGAVTQKGLVVLRPSFVLFVPTESAVNVLGAVGAQLVGVRIIPGKFEDEREYVKALLAEPAATFDAHVGDVWQKAGWWYGTRADSRALFKKVPLFNRYKFGFRRGNEVVGSVFGLPGKLASHVEPLLASWPRV